MNRITTPFGFRSTAAEVAKGIDLTGKRAVVTGAASGIGVETARALAGIGAEVTLAVRDFAAGASVAANITATTHNEAIHVKKLDLVDGNSIRAFVAGWHGPLHILVINDCNEAEPVPQRPADSSGFAHYALDAANAERLWEISLKLLRGSQSFSTFQ